MSRNVLLKIAKFLLQKIQLASSQFDVLELGKLHTDQSKSRHNLWVASSKICIVSVNDLLASSVHPSEIEHLFCD